MLLIQSYRAEIDGVRALAVLAVIVFHMNAMWLPGGYLGVDVFFVISGFLITKILLANLQTNNFSFRQFYERRARRILPALIVVVVACVPLAWFTMDAAQLDSFGKSVAFHGLFASNFFFWTQSGYFAGPADTIPLLHTWSLAVEEQFYVLFPIGLFVCWRYFNRQLGWILLALFVGFLIIAEVGSRLVPDANFYLLPGRGWELLAGSLLAFLELRVGPAKNQLWKAFLPMIGIVLVVASILIFRENTRHPSLNTFPLIAGTALLLRYGGIGFIKHLLSAPPLVFVGKISYSLYLWHFPVLVFSRLYNLGVQPEGFVYWYLPLILVISFVSWRFIENPTRDLKRIPTLLFVQAASSVWSGLLVVGIVLFATHGFPQRLAYPVGLEASFVREDTLGTCIDNVGAHEKPVDWFCEIGTRTTGPINFFVFGDSHAFSLLPSFRLVAKELDVRVIAITDSGCPPLLGLEALRSDQVETDCKRLNDRMLAFAAEQHPKAVFLAARWTYYTAFNQLVREVETGDVPTTDEERLNLLRISVGRTVAAYDNLGVHVAIIGQVPMQEYAPREIYKAVYLSHVNTPEKEYALSVSRISHEDLQRAPTEIFRAAEVAFIDPADALCDDQRCPVGVADISFYFDNGHVSVSSRQLLAPLLLDEILRQGILVDSEVP